MVINFSMDFLALYVTARLMHLKLRPRKLSLAASLGALYSLLALSFGIDGIWAGAVSLMAAFLLTFTAFGKQKPPILLKNTAVFYIVSFALGGGITALCNVLNVWQNKRNVLINGTFDTVYGDIPFGILVILGGVCGAFALISGKIIKRKQTKKEIPLTIVLNNNKITLTGLVDSGNLLTEPISGKAVVIAAYDAIRPLIPIELLSLFKSKDTSNLQDLPLSNKIRVIPTSTVNGNGLIFALIPDEVTINETPMDVYIAITADTNNFGGFSAIIPAEILN